MTTQELIREKFKQLVDEGHNVLARCGWDGRQYQFNREDVEDMVKWVRRFTADHLH